jgi:hypothetical protein
MTAALSILAHGVLRERKAHTVRSQTKECLQTETSEGSTHCSPCQAAFFCWNCPLHPLPLCCQLLPSTCII